MENRLERRRKYQPKPVRCKSGESYLGNGEEQLPKPRWRLRYGSLIGELHRVVRHPGAGVWLSAPTSSIGYAASNKKWRPLIGRSERHSYLLLLADHFTASTFTPSCGVALAIYPTAPGVCATYSTMATSVSTDFGIEACPENTRLRQLKRNALPLLPM
jgi:hypothetical protein